jgi:hypothetical protein
LTSTEKLQRAESTDAQRKRGLRPSTKPPQLKPESEPQINQKLNLKII